MSRERPTRMPRSLPDIHAFVHRAQRAQKEQRERLSATGFGLGFFAGFASRFITTPRWIANSQRKPAEIVAELQAFYARRPRPWRPAANAPKPPRLERLHLERRAAAA